MRCLWAFVCLAAIGCMPATPATTSAPRVDPVAAGDSIPQRQTARVYYWGHSLVDWRDEANPTGIYQVGTPMLAFAADLGLTGCADGTWSKGLWPSNFAHYPDPWENGHDHRPACWKGGWKESDFTIGVITENNFTWKEGREQEQAAEAVKLMARIRQAQPKIDLYLYEHWPEVEPLNAEGFRKWVDEKLDPYAAYFDRLHDEAVRAAPDSRLRLIPVGRTFKKLFEKGGPLGDLGPQDLFVDGSHGRPTLYHLAGMIHFMSLYGRKPGLKFKHPAGVDARIAERWEKIVETAWASVLAHRGRVF